MAPEIITLQLGSYANYVGAHFWNLQDEAIATGQQEDWSNMAASIDHEVFCSWSEDGKGRVSYAPRTVVLDFSGALGGVSFSPDAAEAVAASMAAGSWSGPVQVHSTRRAAKSSFRQQLEAAAEADEGDEAAAAAQQAALEAAALALHQEQQPKYWTDYLQVDLHPSTVLILPGVWQGSSAWHGWGPAPDSSSSREAAEAAGDRVRWWAEQCDRLQGLQVLADDLGGWGGVGRSIVQELREEYASQPLLYFSLQQQQQQQQQQAAANTNSSSSSRRQLSQCMSVAEVTQLASLYVPLVAPASTAGSSSNFQAAALLAAAIDTATLPLRCNSAHTAAGAALGSTDLHSLCHLLAGPAANLAALSLQLPPGELPSSTPEAASQQDTSSSSGALLSLSGSSSSSYLLTAGVQLGPEQCLAESLTLRGARVSAATLACSSQAKAALDALLLQRQRNTIGHPCVSHSCISPMPVALPLSFPHWLGSAAAAAAAASSSGSSSGAAGVRIPMLSRPGMDAVAAPGALSRLTATASFEGVLAGLSSSMRRLVPSGQGRACLDEWGYSVGDTQELQERLMELAQRYDSDDGL
ncbi:hypothetical protein OEZ85_014174 [Tetradesmus obliquus]|uniref:Misato Segment II tubulin-like domain-containing protein n=1 Tax=Tetradesmus obliquus TaxID=3088 RepID=A0ABY8U7E7_TETOB|nr:hypothetical protein OEZ85_014174 [Tetradesmus obliquus]